MDSSVNYNKLEFKIFQLFGRHLRGKRILVASSGGLDSQFLLHILKGLRERCDFHIVVAHVFHGPDSMGYRRRAFHFVRDSAAEFPFVSNVRDPEEVSGNDDLGFAFPQSDEQSLRNFRRDVLRKLALMTGADYIALGHHRDDLLETRLIRLIRGVGLEGLKSMSLRSSRVIRPLLPFWRQQIFEAAKSKGLAYLDDPSNLQTHYLRNWVRGTWLVQLEAYRPGATRALARSLENLAQSARQELLEIQSLIGVEGIDRMGLLSLSNVEQRQIIASYLKRCKVRDYSASHVDEVLKRLRSNKKSFDFRVAGRVWTVSETRVCIHD